MPGAGALHCFIESEAINQWWRVAIEYDYHGSVQTGKEVVEQL
jgi:hypothetical protein